MKKRLAVGSVIAILLMALFALAAFSSDSEMYFSADKNGQLRVTNIQEGDEIWIVVYDPDENDDCDIRDKIWTDVKIFDPKTGAYIVWNRGVDGDFNNADYLEETGADTGLFVSHRSFQIGTRESYVLPIEGTHALPVEDFMWGNYMYVDGFRGYFDCATGEFTRGVIDGGGPPAPPPPPATMGMQPMQEGIEWPCGRFENMDTIVGLYQDPNSLTDVSVAMAKIIDTEATISWDQEIYKDPNGSARITVVDMDENLNCNKVEWVPVFVIINPGSWNQVVADSATNFCALKQLGGIDPADGSVLYEPIRWFNIYDSGLGGPYPDNNQPTSDGAYYIEYPTLDDGNVTYFETTDPNGYVRVMFYAQETGVSTGVFELDINQILLDFGFDRLDVGDVLAAYYLDPNDEDDFKLATAYIETREHVSYTSFTGPTRSPQSEYWLGRDSVYLQVIDANANVDPCCPEMVVVHVCDPHGEDDVEWLILDETTSNSTVFFTNAGMELLPVWDAIGSGIDPANTGGYQLRLDNWKLEAFNEDSIYARYNDQWYTEPQMALLGDGSVATAFPPEIDRMRKDNDISFDVMEITDTQVYDGSSTQMYFLDRNGARVTGYVNSDCVFVEVIDPDQDEDQYRRERIDGFWDANQNFPFGPRALNFFECDFEPELENEINPLLGDTNIFNTGDWAKLYILNPRNGRWAAVDLLETGVATGDFVSVTCIDLQLVYNCAPSLDIHPGDTIIAVYQDPSNHSDSAWLSIKVGIGGGVTPPSQLSTTMFADAEGNTVSTYTDIDDVYVKVIDPSHAGAPLLAGAVEVDGVTYDLTPLAGGQADTFITVAIDLELEAGSTITATYTDPTDPGDESSATATIIASELAVENFYAGPSPFETTTEFSYSGSGIATTFTVTVYDLAGHMVWTDTKANVTGITWDGTDEAGLALANGAYVYAITASDGTNTFTGKGTVFINK